MRKYFEWVTAHPWLVIVVSLLSTAILGYGLRGLVSDAKVENMMPDGHPSVEHARFVEEAFQIESRAVIAVVHEGPDGIYAAHTLKLIQDLTQKLKDIRGVDPKKVWSLFTVSDIVGEANGFAVVPLCPELPADKAAVNALRARVRASKMIYGSMVSKAETGTLIYAAVTPVADKAQVYYDIRRLLAAVPVEGEKFYVTGDPVVQGVLGQYVHDDMRRMMPLVMVLVVLLLLLMFRSLRGLLLPLAGVIFAVVWAMGLMSFVKIPIYPMTTMIPILLMAMGVAYGLHVITRYCIIYQEQLGAGPGVTAREVTILTMMELWSPLIMAATTDAAGFLSLLTSRIKPVFHTGVFTSVGLLAALAFSLALIPAVLAKMKLPKPRATTSSGAQEDVWFRKMGSAVFHGRKGLVALAAVLLVVGLVASRHLIVNSDPMTNFNDRDPIPQSTTIINEQFGGSMMIYTTLEATEAKRFLDPQALAAVDRFQDEVKAIPGVGASLSVVDFLRTMNRAMNEGDPAADVVPPTRNLVGTYLMLYSGENIDHYINYDANRLNIETRLTTTSTGDLERIMGLMDQVADRHLRSLADIKVVIGGHARIVVDMLNIIVYGQIYSIFLSMIFVFIITSVMFRSPIAGLFTAVPITLATVINFATMSVLRIPLEPATAVTSCIGIGVGVDYGIHFIAKYQIMRQRGFQGRELVESTMASAGKSIFFNAAVVIGGFLVLVISMFPPVRHMGFMVSLNMFTSYLASVTVLPAMLAWFQPAFIGSRERSE